MNLVGRILSGSLVGLVAGGFAGFFGAPPWLAAAAGGAAYGVGEAGRAGLPVGGGIVGGAVAGCGAGVLLGLATASPWAAGCAGGAFVGLCWGLRSRVGD